MPGGFNCVVKDCNNSKGRAKPGLMFHNFPVKDKNRIDKWIEFCESESLTKLYESNDPKLKNCFICSEHFEDTKYNNPMKKIRLMCNALPTIKVKDIKRVTTVVITNKMKPQLNYETIPAKLLLRTGANSRRNFKPIVSQTTEMRILEDSTDWPFMEDLMEEKSKENPIRSQISSRYIKLEEEIQTLKTKLRKSRKQVLNFRYRLKRCQPIGNSQKSKLNFILKCLHEMSEKSLNPMVSEMIEYQLESAFLNKQRLKWSNKMKSFCSQLYHKSPTAYCFLQKTLTLPSKKTILKFVESDSSNEKVEHIFASDIETNDDLFVEITNNSNDQQIIESQNNQLEEEEEGLQTEEGHEISPNIVTIDNNCNNNINIEIINKQPIISINRIPLTTQITPIPTYSPVMKTYTRTK